MEVMYIQTEKPEMLELLLDAYEVMYHVEYVPTQHRKNDHFGEVYAAEDKTESVFHFYDETTFTMIREVVEASSIPFQFKFEHVEVVDYQQVFEDAYPVITIGRFTITPPWKMTTNDNMSIVIQPGSGFGTGQSPTTRLCLQWISHQTFTNKQVIDFGSGSGILAIAAAKVGASHVAAFEIDQDACKNAVDNVQINRLSDRVSVVNKENGVFYDVLLMNVTWTIFQDHFDSIWHKIRLCGFISGIHEKEVEALMAFLDKRHIAYVRYEDEEWYGFEVKR